MNDEVRQLFAEHIPVKSPPTALTTDLLVEGGQARARRRRHAITSGALLGLVAVTAAAFAIPTAFAGGDQGTSPAAGLPDTVEIDTTIPAEQPNFPIPGNLPALSDDQWYSFSEPGMGDPSLLQSGATMAYTAALWQWFDDNRPGYTYVSDEFLEADADFRGQDLPGELPVMVRADDSLMINKEVPDGYEGQGTDLYSRPVYLLNATFPDYAAGTSSPILQFPDREIGDLLDLTIYARGSFAPGEGTEFAQLANCTDRDDGYDTADWEFDCEDVTTSTGETALLIERTVVTGGQITERLNEVILYRHDGTAVQVRDNIPGYTVRDESPPVEHLTPALSLTELTALAVSLPGYTVE